MSLFYTLTFQNNSEKELTNIELVNYFKCPIEGDDLCPTLASGESVSVTADGGAAYFTRQTKAIAAAYDVPFGYDGFRVEISETESVSPPEE